ncbi:MAG TPA: hypothetical protein VJR89_33390, partial [Polyangiales bacterium]|nr:hypothetical protein [Polyangiales bacterium]
LRENRSSDRSSQHLRHGSSANLAADGGGAVFTTSSWMRSSDPIYHSDDTGYFSGFSANGRVSTHLVGMHRAAYDSSDEPIDAGPLLVTASVAVLRPGGSLALHGPRARRERKCRTVGHQRSGELTSKKRGL